MPSDSLDEVWLIRQHPGEQLPTVGLEQVPTPGRSGPVTLHTRVQMPLSP
jgi:hypothetical protein